MVTVFFVSSEFGLDSCDFADFLLLFGFIHDFFRVIGLLFRAFMSIFRKLVRILDGVLEEI